ncbi:MAG: hypothetical protein N4J56_007294 [Chroococcidiopsis sp. SAG 2025]|nr:hypothetical protein [Chroococcidiopsis sp. SAG 2025]
MSRDSQPTQLGWFSGDRRIAGWGSGYIPTQQSGHRLHSGREIREKRRWEKGVLRGGGGEGNLRQSPERSVANQIIGLEGVGVRTHLKQGILKVIE